MDNLKYTTECEKYYLPAVYSYMNIPEHNCIDEMIKENIRKREWYYKEFCCSFADFCNKPEYIIKLEQLYYENNTSLFQYIQVPYFIADCSSPIPYNYFSYSKVINNERENGTS